ncbi:MAG: DUF4440 domain-containing protein [Acidobacteria bacterium]|nr:MAG: DUF4440 domain-containing protein [Acidobacteriota bacterium]
MSHPTVLAALPLLLLLAAPTTPEEAVDAFHRALAEGDREAALELLSPAVTIFESGGAELSRDEYAGHHLGADMSFAAAVERTVIDRRSEIRGDAAWVLTRSRTQGTFRDRPIDSRDAETMILRRSDDGWRIVHVHWSSRPAARPAP